MIERMSLQEWDARYESMHGSYPYAGPLGRHVRDGDLRLPKLLYDSSPAALRLWNFLLTEEERLRHARSQGKTIVGTMKDLGTVPVMVYSLPDTVAFYPDGAWWIPCIMECSTSDLAIADSLGIDESFCPVRAMLGAFVSGEHFPRPDLLICSAGATCDDFSAIAQRLESIGYPVHWWEIPHRHKPESDEPAVVLPGGFVAPKSQVEFVQGQLACVKDALERCTGQSLSDAMMAGGIRSANAIRRVLAELRRLAYIVDPCPLPALEMQIAEMLAIHFCSDREESLVVLGELLTEVRRRVSAGGGVLPAGAARIFWVNPVADLRIMNLLEECGGRVCGTDYLFGHALDEIPEDIPPLQALAQMALADPMVGGAADRADRICRDIQAFGAQGVIISRIPGASHCATEGSIIADAIASRLELPVLEIETPPLIDAMLPSLRTRIEALVETVGKSSL